MKNCKLLEENNVFSLTYVQKFTKNYYLLPQTLDQKLKTQAKKLNFRHFQNRWISAKSTKKKPGLQTPNKHCQILTKT